jgi:hypothetical protein
VLSEELLNHNFAATQGQRMASAKAKKQKPRERGLVSGGVMLLLLEVFSDGLASGADRFHCPFQLDLGALEGLDPQLHLIGVVDVELLGIKGMSDGVSVRHANLNLLK